MKKKTQKQKNYERGLWAEYLAAAYFRLKGYRILNTRYKTPSGEIDLIAARGKTLVIAEVKARSKIDDALRAVMPRGQRRIEQAVRHYLASHPQFYLYDVRFDVVVYAWPFSLRHLDNAWQARS